MQEAIACYAVASLATIKHQLWELYASIGKSRIIACIGLMALSSKVVKTVHIVVPNAALKRRDESDFGDYWKFSGLETCVKYHDKLDFKPTKMDLLIVDEADKLVFEDPLQAQGCPESMPHDLLHRNLTQLQADGPGAEDHRPIGDAHAYLRVEGFGADRDLP